MIFKLARTACTVVGAGVLAGAAVQTLHGLRHPRPVKVAEAQPSMFFSEGLPSDVWAPDIIGEYLTSMLDDMRAKAEADGVVLNWSAVEIHFHDADDLVLVHASAPLLT